ncbi:hypothetical protein [Sphingobium aquiterrae]|uniref:hypothetical protein n=1 Tax=Sphingobium aquiterrae TaxID=2038656 RepID=UPI0030198155
MSNISGIMSSASGFSPRAMMDKRIDSAVQAGKLSETDETALETALDAIDAVLGAGASSASGTETTRLDPSEMKSRIDSLIDDQVSAGTLTEDQATALQSFFAQGGPQPAGAMEGSSETASADGVEGAGCAGGPQGMRGPPPPPPASDDSDSDDSTTTSESSAADKLDAIIAFLENLRQTMASSTYGASTSSTDSANSGLVVDSLA